MSAIVTIVDQAVADALAAKMFDVLSDDAKLSARRNVVRHVTRALRESLTQHKDANDAAEGETETTPQPAPSVRMGAWSREWWAALIRRIERKQSTDLMMRLASSGSVWAGEQEAVLPDTIAAMRAYPSDGPEVAAWRPWFKQNRVNLPDWRERVWVFLPSTGPPGETNAA